MKYVLSIFFISHYLVALNTAKLLSSSSIIKRQAGPPPYICGSNPYRYFSYQPCNYQPVCPTGGFKMNQPCVTDNDCFIFNAQWRCVNNFCCSPPQLDQNLYTPAPFSPNGPFYDSAAAPQTPFTPLLITVFAFILYFLNL